MSADLLGATQCVPAKAECRKLFTFAATLTRRETNGSRSVVLAHGFRIAMEKQDTLAEHWLRHVMAQHPGFSLSGRVSVLEITRDDLAMMACAHDQGG